MRGGLWPYYYIVPPAAGLSLFPPVRVKTTKGSGPARMAGPGPRKAAYLYVVRLINRRPPSRRTIRLGDNPADHSGAHLRRHLGSRTAAFFDGDRGNQFDRIFDVVARQHHFHARPAACNSGHSRGSEVELRPLAVEERGVPPAFLLGQAVILQR